MRYVQEVRFAMPAVCRYFCLKSHGVSHKSGQYIITPTNMIVSPIFWINLTNHYSLHSQYPYRQPCFFPLNTMVNLTATHVVEIKQISRISTHDPSLTGDGNCFVFPIRWLYDFMLSIARYQFSNDKYSHPTTFNICIPQHSYWCKLYP